MTEKKAYTPAEFAALFGREKTWTYRMLYAGKIEGISDFGRMMIAASEVGRIESAGGRYLGKKKAPGKATKKAVKVAKAERTSQPPAKGSDQWSGWIEKRRGKSQKAKGMGSHAKPVNRPKKD